MMSFNEFREAHDWASYVDGLEIEKAYMAYFRENAQVGDGVTVHLWSDAHAYTIIKRTRNTLTLRRCKATLVKDWKPEFVPGGFSATCINSGDQRWIYEEDEDGSVVKAHWSDLHGFRVDGCCIVVPGRHEYYDYNF